MCHHCPSERSMLAGGSIPSIPAIRGMEGQDPRQHWVFHTFHTFHTYFQTLYTHASACTRARVRARPHLFIFSMEGMEGMEEQALARLSGFHTSAGRYGRCGRYGTPVGRAR